ncbi:MAG TPA: UDP-N-acetylmuramate dehydrogenase [Methylomirabilota bacterium]|nr:UDP-N-acetylmuramate dehydrogenase [Methylomirabilota bacterium]
MTVHKDYDLSQLLWYKIGGKAKYLLACSNEEDVKEAIAFIHENNIHKVFVCGMGSNLIFSDNYFNGAVIHLVKKKESSIVLIKDIFIEAFAGESFGDVILFSLDHGLVGLEWAGGLPGTLGAAVRGNVGAFGGEIKDRLISASILDYSGRQPKLATFTNDQFAFVYRGSLVKTHKKMIVISARFALHKGRPEEVAAAKQVYHRNIQFREARHPLEYPNCGSVFKNLRDKDQIEKVLQVYPDLKEDVEKRWYGKIAVASLIERLGLKGYRVGGAQVSEKHALFIVNRGHATAKDVLHVIADIQKKFEKTFGFQLDLEVEVVR